MIMLRVKSPRLNSRHVTCNFRQKLTFWKYCLEPSLILAGERFNDKSCLNLLTWCQADASLLAGDVLQPHSLF